MEKQPQTIIQKLGQQVRDFRPDAKTVALVATAAGLTEAIVAEDPKIKTVGAIVYLGGAIGGPVLRKIQAERNRGT